MKAKGGMKLNEDSTQGIAAVSGVINVVLTRVYPQAPRSQFNRRNEGQFEVWVKSNMIPQVTALEFKYMVQHVRLTQLRFSGLTTRRVTFSKVSIVAVR